MMPLNIVHFSKTPLAGAPICLVQALQRHTDYDVRLVDLKRWGIFDNDVVFDENAEEAISIAEQADIVHLHNYLDYNSDDFYPINFASLQKSGKVFVRHFHSTPMLVAGAMGVSIQQLLESPIPSIVIAQYPERFYPNARVVPNIIPQDVPLYRPTREYMDHDVFFSPSSTCGAWNDRWNTKGAPETVLMMKQVAHRTGCRIKFFTGRPFTEMLQEKRKARIIIDELITGSYHLSGLEGLSLGKPVLAFLDDRTRHVLREISGSDTCPFINVRLEDSFDVLVYLLAHPDEAADIGKANREWVERYWLDHVLVQRYVEIYNKLLINPELVTRQPELRIDNRVVHFFGVTLPDIIHQTRASHYNKGLPIWQRMATQTNTWATRLTQDAGTHLPNFLKIPLRAIWRFVDRLHMKTFKGASWRR